MNYIPEMKFKLLNLFIFYTITSSAQTTQKDTLLKKAYQSATVNTLFEDSDNVALNKYAESNLSENLSQEFFKRQTLRQASQYISKLQYTEAAKLYESILKNGGSQELVENLGDMYYFDLDMEKSCALYEKMYKQDADKMSASALYKYYLALEGTGRYNKADKVLGLFKKKDKLEITLKIYNTKNRINSRRRLTEILAQKPLFSVHNLDFNNQYSDFSPVLYNENQFIFSSSNSEKGYQDLYVLELDKELKNVIQSKKLPENINSPYHETAATLSADCKTMYFTRGNLVHGLNTRINKLKLFKSVNVNGQWSTPTQVSFSSDYYSVGHPALSPDGKKLYFASDMPGSLGASDIFVVDIYDDGSYSKPKNLGPKINTQGDEQFPYVTETKLYFSSNGHAGLGGVDIFEIPLNDTSGFAQLKNLGQPINSDEDDFSLIINETEQKGFFSSNRRGGQGGDDIYSFELIKP